MPKDTNRKAAIPLPVKFQLWRKSGGRCQFCGCNKPLWIESVEKNEFNTSYVAHIYGEKPKSARYEKGTSEELAKDINNLMLMCDEHHRLIDGDSVGYPPELLLEMKRRHEHRIEIVTSIKEEKASYVLLFGAKVGTHDVPLTWDQTVPAMLPEFYPAEKPGIEIGIEKSPFEDYQKEYWNLEIHNLRSKFANTVLPKLNHGDCHHLSVFARAPQPLLIELGRLLSDIRACEVYQLHREPSDWKWQKSPSGFSYQIIEPDSNHAKVALNLSLSGTITGGRITEILGDEVSIWTITIPDPNNDYVKGREQVAQFRVAFRKLLDRIKARHGQNTELSLFPAVPVSIAVEIGRVWMPKADVQMTVYDQNNSMKKFNHATEVRSE